MLMLRACNKQLSSVILHRWHVVIWSYTTVPVAFRLPFLGIFTNLEVQERYLPIIRGAGTPFPCVPNSHGTLTTARRSIAAATCGGLLLSSGAGGRYRSTSAAVQPFCCCRAHRRLHMTRGPRKFWSDCKEVQDRPTSYWQCDVMPGKAIWRL